MAEWCILLDSGSLFGSYGSRDEAHKQAAHLARVREADIARGELVTLRRIIGVIHVIHKPLKPISPPLRQRRKVKTRGE